MHRLDRNTRSATRNIRVSRWMCALSLFLILCACTVSAAGPLGNPAEKEFGNDSDAVETPSRRGPVFSDQTIPDQKDIRLVSGSASSVPDIWANPAPPSDHPTPDVWGGFTAPSAAAPSVADGMNHGTLPVSPPAQNNPSPYYTTGLPQNASPTGNFYGQGSPYIGTGYGSGYDYNANAGYYDPSTGQIYAVNPAAGYGYTDGYTGNPFSSPYSMMGGQQGGMDYNTGYNTDYNAVYQALLIQEMTRRQAEEAREQSVTDDETKKREEAKKEADAGWSMNSLMPVKVSSPLGDTLFACAKTISPFCTPTGPDKGVGMPLVNKSWLDHPWYAGGFCGWISGSELIAGMIDQKNGGTGGLIAGYNLNEYWGVESRLHFASIDAQLTARGRQIYEELTGLTAGVPKLTNQLSVIDLSVHYYPLGNAKWRPFFKYGLGAGHETFVDMYGRKQSENVITMPLGVGLRYWWNERLAIQMDLIDNVVFASGGAKTQGNISFAVGLTYSFGSGKKTRPIQYWPANPSMGSKW